MLDKEVAEERYEAAESSLEAAKEKVAELHVEVTVLREENARMEGTGEETGPRGEGGKDSLAYVQLEKQNGRLKDALARSVRSSSYARSIADVFVQLARSHCRDGSRPSTQNR